MNKRSRRVLAISISQGLNGCSKLIDLPLWMGARIARIGNEVAHWPVGDDQP
jgi:hypothetical protein